MKPLKIKKMIEKALTSLKTSVFGWESSYFGGYERVVYDHPFIYVPREIEFRYINTTGSSIYIADKICALFLHRVKTFNMMKVLLHNSRVEKSIDWMGNETPVVIMHKSSIKNCLNNVIANETELQNLFIHYRSFLESIAIHYYPSKGDDKRAGEGGEGISKEEKLKDLAEQAMEKTKEHKPYSASSKDAVSGDLKDQTEFVIMSKQMTPCSYSQTIIKQANALVNMLDISFDPKQDKIENLRCGKMSQHKIAEIPSGNTHIYHRVEEDQTTRPFSICILADESGSMRHRDLRTKQNELMKMLYYAFSQIIPQDKMFFFGHSGQETPEIRVYHDRYNPNFEYTIENQLDNDFCENYDGPVVECVYERVRSQTSDNIIFISISDGEPAGHDYGGREAVKELKRVIERCKRDGFVTVGVGLQFGQIKDIYNYHTIVMKMDKLVKSVSSLINQVVKTEFKD